MSLVHPRVHNKIIRKAATAIAVGFGLGYSPVASGTVGAILGCGIVLGFTELELPVLWQIVACLALSVFCIPCASIAEKELGGIKDNGKIVADEYLTFPICMIGLLPYWQDHIWLMPVCFVVNRVFDILKPFPAYQSQILPSGLGVTIDDFIISWYALAVNWGIFHFLGKTIDGIF